MFGTGGANKRPRSVDDNDEPPNVTAPSVSNEEQRDRAYKTIIAALQRRVDSLSSQLSARPTVTPVEPGSSTSSGHQEETILDLEKSNQKLTDRVRFLEQRHQKEVEKARTEISKMSSRLNALESDNRKLQRELHEVKIAKEILERNIAQATEEINLQTSLRQKLRENHDNLWNEYQRTTARADGFMQRIFALQSDLEREIGTKRELVAEVQRLSAKVDSSGYGSMPDNDETHRYDARSDQRTADNTSSEVNVRHAHEN